MVFDGDRPLQLCRRYPDDPPGADVLLVGHTPTVFPDYEMARLANRRTRNYARRRGWSEDWGLNFTIRRVEVLGA